MSRKRTEIRSRFSPPRLLELLSGCVSLVLTGSSVLSADFSPAPQQFGQEVSQHFSEDQGIPAGAVQLVDRVPDGAVRVFSSGQWYAFDGTRFNLQTESRKPAEAEFVFLDGHAKTIRADLPWHEVRQILRLPSRTWVASSARCVTFDASGRQETSFPFPAGAALNQLAASPSGQLYLACSRGLFALHENTWKAVEIADDVGRVWGTRDVRGVGFDRDGKLWVAMKAGIACRAGEKWRFYEGKEGLPWNDFTGVVPGPAGEVWFTTHRGVIRFDGNDWHYRQGPCWLPHDNVVQGVVDDQGRAWFGTERGLGSIERRPMTLAQKADSYEQEIGSFVKRTPFGYVAEAALRKVADKSSANPQDSDNDGLWTAMYGAGECFAYAATKDPKAKERAKGAFEALRFLQKVTQGCEHAPPKGYIARTIRPVEWPDPNIGRLEQDRENAKGDKLWKVYEPRWPKSADGKWYWKSDTSSDELDGHYFFYPLYYDFCANTDAERERLREVVRDITDHLISHGFNLIDHDGKPTRWGIYGPEYLNHDPLWWQERGLKSLSMLSYLAVAEHVTGDAKYARASRELIDRHGYAHNAMHPKVQSGPGSGNQSDDEMAFMCYYGLLRCSKDEALKNLIRSSFYRYWVNEAPEMNPFFNFAYAAVNRGATSSNPFGDFSVQPWAGWHEDAMRTLYGFPLDRLNWPHQNSHRLDIVLLSPVQAPDIESPDQNRGRGRRVNGKVLPVENRHFNHWNTDPWALNYGGNGGELAAGTVFLLPYYMGLYHGFIQKPGN